MMEQLIQNWICYAILLLAVFCYQQLSHQYLLVNSKPQRSSFNNMLVNEQQFCGILIAALPLLGLLGTIIGLLECFAAMSNQGTDVQRMSAGIGDALFTTQLGLVCAIPAWIFQSAIKAKIARYQMAGIN